MSTTFLDITVSLDGYVAGPDAGTEHPLGIGGLALHEWAVKTRSWRAAHGHSGGVDDQDSDVVAETVGRAGAVLMGRRMFDGDSGPWGEEPSRGWWGEDPPFAVPVFVVTHHEREPLVMQGREAFTFVTGGVEEAIARAGDAAGDRDVLISGGANVAQQALRAGRLDELQLHIVPLLLGGGVRLLDGLDGDLPQLELARTVASPTVTHVTYRVAR